MKAREAELGLLYLFFDLMILNTAIIAMGWFSESISINNYREMSIYLLKGNLSYILTYLIFTKTNLYVNDRFKARVARIIKQTLIFLGISLFISFFIIPLQYSKLFLLEYTAMFFAGKLLFYWLLYKYLRLKREKGINTKHALIVGLSDASLKLQNILDSNFILGYHFIGFVDDHGPGNLDVLGSPSDLASLIDRHHIEMVFVMRPIFAQENRLIEYLKICNRKGIHLRIISESQYLFKSQESRLAPERLLMINPQEIPLDKLSYRVYKRIFDLVFSILSILLIFTWLFPIVILLIKLSSKGPIFFRQKRTGTNNEVFKCIKFRSMRVSLDADIKQATEHDSRITPFGSFMRSTHLDELPQFFNVFLGQMSVVGPRPHMLKHTEIYSGLIKHYLVRHYMKPGVTGFAQVSGYCGETDELWKMEKRVEYDMIYIENWTFWWDIKIIWCSLVGCKSRKYVQEMMKQAAM